MAGVSASARDGERPQRGHKLTVVSAIGAAQIKRNFQCTALLTRGSPREVALRIAGLAAVDLLTAGQLHV